MEVLHSHQFAAPDRLPAECSDLQGVSEAELREIVAAISHPRHFIAEPDQNRATADWLVKNFRSLGYDVREQGSCRNVIAFRAGLSFSEPLEIVGAHYDSVPGSPGADDNGSAVAAMIGCAGALARGSHHAPVVFAAFNREEEGFIGSGEFVREFARRQFPRIACAHILEMVGFASDAAGSQHLPTGLPIQLRDTGDFLGLLSNGQSAAGMRHVLALSRACTPELPVTGLTVGPGAERVFPVLARSDHVPFWAQQIPALMWTDTAEFRNPNYHEPTDTPVTLDYTFLKRVTRLLTAAIAAARS